MKYCKTCHVHYDNTLEHCILCNGELDQVGEELSTYKFPEIKKRSKSRFFYRLFLFLNLVSALVTLYIDFADGLPLTWSLVVGITNIYVVVMFLVLAVPTIWTHRLTKSVIITVGSLILIGLAIRDVDWALDFVFPFAVMSNIFIITLLILVNKKKWFDYFSSLIFITIIGLVPGLLNVLNLTVVQWPSLVCFAFSTFTLFGILILPSKSSREEFKRRFHI
ncbi:MAG: hypothetical protein KKH92_03385 [Firmicutes bacterium]|nr:hypothetical protein [Bacillota bacterium]